MVSVKFTTDRDVYAAYSGAKINYSLDELPDGIWIVPSGLLVEENITSQDIHVTKWEHYKIFFQVENGELPFDLFSAAFYLVSRYEEYLPFVPDRHGRYTETESLAGRNNFLKNPVVDQWALLLSKLILKKYPEVIFPERVFKYIPTIDVDMAYSYLSKGGLRNTLGFFRDILMGNIKCFIERIYVLLGAKKDPFDTFENLTDRFEEQDLQAVFFFQVGRYGKYDKNISLKKKRFIDLILSISKKYQVGIHPSYRSFYDHAELECEVNDLQGVIDQAVFKSRQHYLKLSLPDTYRKLIALDIKEDYSMGYAEETGFRASTCTPFLFYDLAAEVETSLKVISFQIMDVTFSKYLNLTQEEAIFEIQKIKNKVKEVDGTFVAIFHNNEDLGFRI